MTGRERLIETQTEMGTEAQREHHGNTIFRDWKHNENDKSASSHGKIREDGTCSWTGVQDSWMPCILEEI